jgi:multidrug resistance efflux pump
MRWLFNGCIVMLLSVPANRSAIAGVDPTPFAIESANASQAVTKAQASVALAEVKLAYAEVALKRARALNDRPVLPTSDYEMTQAYYEEAKVALAAEKARLDRAKPR